MTDIVVHGVSFQLQEDAAPHQFSSPKDPMMIYRIFIADELICATDEGSDLKEMVQICDSAIEFFKQTKKFLKKKKQIGDRCT